MDPSCLICMFTSILLNFNHVMAANLPGLSFIPYSIENSYNTFFLNPCFNKHIQYNFSIFLLF